MDLEISLIDVAPLVCDFVGLCLAERGQMQRREVEH